MCYGADTETVESSDSDVEQEATSPQGETEIALSGDGELLYVRVDGGSFKAIFIRGDHAEDDKLSNVGIRHVPLNATRFVTADTDNGSEIIEGDSDPDSTPARENRLAAAEEDTGVDLHEQVDIIARVAQGEVVGFGRIDNPDSGATNERQVIVNVGGTLRVVHPSNLLPSEN